MRFFSLLDNNVNMNTTLCHVLTMMTRLAHWKLYSNGSKEHKLKLEEQLEAERSAGGGYRSRSVS